MPEKKSKNHVLATKQSVFNSEDRKRALRENIRKRLFQLRCTCEGNKCANGDYSNICFSFKGLAKLLNEEGIPSLRGFKGSWQTTQVRRLFPRSFSNNAKCSNSCDKNSEKTALDGLI